MMPAPHRIIATTSQATQTVDWWRRNFVRVLAQHVTVAADEAAQRDVAELRAKGIVVRHAQEVLGRQSSTLLESVAAMTTRRVAQADAGTVLARAHSGDSGKDYIYHLLPKEIEFDNPYVQLALQPEILARVNGYMGMKSSIRAIELWLTFPTPGAEKETQLWHRDADDRRNVKVFLYFTDVGRHQGPLCFVPGTHRRQRPFFELKSGSGPYAIDGRLHEEPPREAVVECVGPKGTIVFADTTGFHKGMKPLAGFRVALMIQYTSGAPAYPRSFSLSGTPTFALTKDQRWALAIR